jgi:hypothetical protein
MILSCRWSLMSGDDNQEKGRESDRFRHATLSRPRQPPPPQRLSFRLHHAQALTIQPCTANGTTQACTSVPSRSKVDNGCRSATRGGARGRGRPPHLGALAHCQELDGTGH